MKSLLDPSFKYYSSAQTDLRRTFARVKREQSKGRSDSNEEANAVQCSEGTETQARHDAAGVLEPSGNNSIRRLPIRERKAGA